MKRYSIILLAWIIISCSPGKRINNTVSIDLDLDPGSSGMEQIDDHTFIAVYDLKNFQKGPRIGLIQSYADSINVHAIEVSNWQSDEGIPSDLEAICAIPGRSHEFLMNESGNWQGKLGRIFHIKLDLESKSAKVLGVIKMPMINKNDIGLTGDQYEGIACILNTEQTYQIILAERGGSEAYPHGLLKWANLDLDNHQLTFSDKGKAGIQVIAPGSWVNETSKRDITDLHIDKEGTIWAAASQDNGDAGPFNSVIYKLGRVNMDGEVPFTINENLEVYKMLSGYKIEALSGPSSAAPSSNLSFGTEDEIYGGTWRPIE